MNQDDSWAPIREYSAGKRGRRFPWEGGAALVVVIGVLTWFLGPRYLESRRASQEKVIMDHMYNYLVGADQFFRENPGRLFVVHQELAGSTGPQKATFVPVAGEDYLVLFPIRRDHPELAVRTGDGRRVIWFTYEDAVGQPRLALVSERSNGALAGEAGMIKAYRQFRDGEEPDGVHEKRFPDGSRFETTYRGGVPHGPFKAYYPDGRPWGEATYENGRVVGPCWNYPRAGARFDEMAPVDFSRALMTVP